MKVSSPSLIAPEWPEALRLKIADCLFNNSSEGVCITDDQERIREVNPTFCKLSGYLKEELLGNTPRMLSSGLQEREFFTNMWDVLRDSGEWQGELWNRKKSGELFAVRLNISTIHNARGKVSHYLSIMADVTAMKVQHQEWERNANYDQLTGLPNRTLLMDHLHQALALSMRTNRLLGICYLDLDGFKAVNDTHGHGAGDTVLVEVAQRLHQSVRAGDTVARMGGDEFVILLWGLANIQECNNTLSRALSKVQRPINLPGAEVSITVSVGVTVFPQDGEDPVLLMTQADSAMYRSKIAGGNRFTYYVSVQD